MHVLTYLSLLLAGAIATNGVTTASLRDGLDDIDIGELFRFNVDTFLRSYGYPFENHEVVTEDGYVLGVHRIPNGRSESSKLTESSPKPAVLLMHGIASDSADYFILGPEKSLPLMLADAGYDVWLGNNRGTTWSRKHLALDPDNGTAFWDYSFHELGVYDVPAAIDHILNTTGLSSLSYVGHSQGTTQFFVTMSSRPEYNEKINSMVALAPVVFMSNTQNPVYQFLKDYIPVVDVLTNALNLTEVLPNSPLMSIALAFVCSDKSPLQPICAAAYFFEGESDQLDKSLLPVIVQTHPGGASMKGYKHFLQEIKSEHFRQYDYGLVENVLRYGQVEPPDYDLSKVTAPVTLLRGDKDTSATELDVTRLAEAIPNVVEHRQLDGYCHNDFLFGKKVPTLYKEIIESFDKLKQ